ncbi:MAG: peroxiredoxin [Symbiobacteriia bacterium]
MTLKVGDTAPDFTLKGTGEKEDITLSELGGKPTVVLFFPFAFSPVCTDELCSVQSEWDLYESLGAQVLGISVDSLYTQKAFASANKINFPLLADFNKEVAPKYGAFYEQLGPWKGVAKRAAFVVDRNGKVAYAWVSDDPKVKPDPNAIRTVLSGLK